MKLRRILIGLSLLCATIAAALAVSGSATAQDSGSVLRIGWAQDPGTLNPFVGLDEEDYNVWAMNWDLLVNFDPKDLSPAPGIAKSWTVSDDKKTITFKLDPNAKWSDGKPITSADVKWSLDVLGDNGVLFTNYTSNVTRIDTPDPTTVVVHTSRPDARIIGGLFIYILPEAHLGQGAAEGADGHLQAGAAAGRQRAVHRHRVRARADPQDRAQPELPRARAGLRPDPVHQVRQPGRGRARAPARRDRHGRRGRARTTSPASARSRTSRRSQRASPSYTELAFNLCPARFCPDAKFNPAVQDRDVRQAIAYAIDRERINTIAARDTSFPAHGILPEFYKSFYQQPEQDYPFDPDMGNQILDDAGWVMGDDGVRTKGDERLEFNLYVRSESPYNIQAAKLVAEETKEIGVKFNVQVVSVDKLTDLTVQKTDGKPSPDFDTFIWGWGGDPYDPSFLLSLFLTKEIGGLSDSFYSNPEYDKLFDEQAGSFDVAERKAIIQRMVAITQRDLPYIVLTYDANLQAYRTDTIQNVSLQCPADETGDIICEQVGYEPLLSITPAAGGGGSDEGAGQSAGLAVVVAIVFGIGGWLLGVRQSRRRESEPLELPE